MKRSQPTKSSFMMRNNSLNQKPAHRINSLEKQLNQLTQLKRKTDQCQMKEESSAIMELLQIKDQHIEWKDKNLKHKSRNPKHKNNPRHPIHSDDHTSQIFDSQEQFKKDFRKQQHLIYPPPFLDNIFIKRNTHEEISSKNSLMKKSQQFSQNYYHNMLKESTNNDNFFMNRTHYRNKQHYNNRNSHERNQDFSLTQRMNHRFLPKQIFYQKQLNDSMRVNSNFQFYRNKSPLDKDQHDDQENIKKMVVSGTVQNNKSIKILANKSITVRQMLQKINSHQDINIAQPQIQHQKLKSLLESHSNRHPFDPYAKKTPRQHQRKFTPFKIEQQRKLQYSLQKLEQRIRKNPEMDNKWDELELKYLEKPTYCSWVKRNKEKIRRRRNQPLTVRPLKLLN